MYRKLNVLLIRHLIQALELNVLCLWWSVLYNLSHKVRHKRIRMYICDRLTKRLPGLSYYVLFYCFNCHILELFWHIGFFVAFFLTIPSFVRQILWEKLFIPDKKYFIRQRSYQWKMPWHCSRCTWGRFTTHGLVIQVMWANQKNSQGCQLAWRNGRILSLLGLDADVTQGEFSGIIPNFWQASLDNSI